MSTAREARNAANPRVQARQVIDLPKGSDAPLSCAYMQDPGKTGPESSDDQARCGHLVERPEGVGFGSQGCRKQAHGGTSDDNVPQLGLACRLGT
jgi:hypothetical protein